MGGAIGRHADLGQAALDLVEVRLGLQQLEELGLGKPEPGRSQADRDQRTGTECGDGGRSPGADRLISDRLIADPLGNVVRGVTSTRGRSRSRARPGRAWQRTERAQALDVGLLPQSMAEPTLDDGSSTSRLSSRRLRLVL